MWSVRRPSFAGGLHKFHVPTIGMVAMAAADVLKSPAMTHGSGAACKAAMPSGGGWLPQCVSCLTAVRRCCADNV